MRKLNLAEIQYTNTKLLQKFLTPSGSMVPRSKSGVSNKVQRRIGREIKRARHLALLPFTSTL